MGACLRVLIAVAGFGFLLGVLLPRSSFGQEPPDFVTLNPTVFKDGFLSLDSRLGKLTEDGAVEAYGYEITIEVKQIKKRRVYKVSVDETTKTHATFPILVTLDEHRAVHLLPWSRDRFLCISALGAKFTRDGQDFYVIDADMNMTLGEIGRDALAGPDARTLTLLGDSFWTETGHYKMHFAKDPVGPTKLSFTASPPENAPPSSLEGLYYTNALRQSMGSKPLRWEEKFTKGCREHIEYCCRNNYFGHFQDPKKKAYTLEGARAGRQSVLAAGPMTYIKGMVSLVRTAYHCAGIINPDLESTAWVFEKGILVWNVGAGISRNKRNPALRKDIIGFWPPNGAVNVYRAFNPSGEKPMPIRGKEHYHIANIGQVVFVETGKPEGEGFYDVVLLDDRGRRHKGFLTTPMRPIFTGLLKGVAVRKNGGLACLAPKKLLRPKTRYTVEVYEGDFWKKKLIFSWWFATGTR